MSDAILCLFCREPVGDDAISDVNGEIACRECGEAEWEAQRQEGFINQQIMQEEK